MIVGTDCALILDGTGYFVDPTSYAESRPRVHAATITLGAAGGAPAIRFADLGPAKRQWTFIVLAHQDMRTYAGEFVAMTGEQYRAALKASYEKLSTLSFTDPKGDTFNVYFTDMTYQIEDVSAQAAGTGPSSSELQYSIHVTLLEA